MSCHDPSTSPEPKLRSPTAAGDGLRVWLTVTGRVGTNGGPVPFAFTAVTVNVYVVPLKRLGYAKLTLWAGWCGPRASSPGSAASVS